MLSEGSPTPSSSLRSRKSATYHRHTKSTREGWQDLNSRDEKVVPFVDKQTDGGSDMIESNNNRERRGKKEIIPHPTNRYTYKWIKGIELRRDGYRPCRWWRASSPCGCCGSRPRPRCRPSHDSPSPRSHSLSLSPLSSLSLPEKRTAKPKKREGLVGE